MGDLHLPTILVEAMRCTEDPAIADDCTAAVYVVDKEREVIIHDNVGGARWGIANAYGNDGSALWEVIGSGDVFDLSNDFRNGLCVATAEVRRIWVSEAAGWVPLVHIIEGGQEAADTAAFPTHTQHRF